MQERLDVAVVRVVAEVAVELAVIDIARIAFFSGPDLLAAFGVARERGDSAGAEHRPERTVARPRRTKRNAVRVDEEELDARFAQVPVNARRVRALGQP